MISLGQLPFPCKKEQNKTKTKPQNKTKKTQINNQSKKPPTNTHTKKLTQKTPNNNKPQHQPDKKPTLSQTPPPQTPKDYINLISSHTLQFSINPAYILQTSVIREDPSSPIMLQTRIKNDYSLS